MNLSIPEIIQFQQTSRHDTAWSDLYGDLYVTTNYCNVDLEKNISSYVWQHDCEGPWSSPPEMLVRNATTAREKELFVAREQEENLTKLSGYTKAKMISLSISPDQTIDLERVPNTLLIIPQHTLLVLKRGSDEAQREYVGLIRSHLSSFDVVAACVSPSCLTNGYFASEFNEPGIKIIPEASSSDLNALFRMRCLSEQFETMTINGRGSHLAYALAFGIKHHELLKDHTWESFDENRLRFIRLKVEVGEQIN